MSVSENNADKGPLTIRLAKVFGAPPGRPSCEALAIELNTHSLRVAPVELRAIADTVAAHRDEVLQIPELAPCANDLAKRPE